MFAVDLARSGHDATGIDPAAAMIEAARARLGGGLVRWVQRDAGDTDVASADLVVMMGHVAQYFVEDDHWQSTLDQVQRALAPRGHLVFEVRNPLLDWERSWTRERTTGEYAHPDGGTFTSWVQVVDRVGRADSYRMTHQGHSVLPNGDHLHACETLRFRSADEIVQSLDAAGFSVAARWGGWDKAPMTEQSEELIFLATSA